MDPVSLMSLLSDSTRLAAMRLLWDGQEHCLCELMERIGATQSRMSRHMSALRSAGLVTDRRDAQWVRYRRNPDLPRPVATVIEAVLALPVRGRGPQTEEVAA